MMPKIETLTSINRFIRRLYGSANLNPFSFDTASPNVFFELLPTILPDPVT